MKKFRRVLLLLFLTIILIYVCNLSAIPQNIVLFQGESLNVKKIFGISISSKKNENKTINVGAIPADTNNISDNVGTYDLSVNVANIKVKDMTINVIPKSYVVIAGNTIGAKLYTNGVLVVGMSEIEGNKPYENSGIEEGDMIVEVDKKVITCTADLVKEVNNSNGNNVEVKYLRDGEEFETNLNPARTQDNEYKLGLWVRDAAAGVGTMTFYDPNSNNFAALGHGILDVDTGKLINIARGELVTSKIIDIKKGENGNPGELRGTIENGSTVGEIYKNTYFGIYGNVKNKSSLNLNENELVEVANRDEVKTGEAKVICSLDGENRKEYKINIEKVYYNNNSDNKSMLVKVEDEDLINKTGGIIQGMSGSPIIQNGKFIGCLTHVLVNNSKEGYAVFGDLMIKEMNK